MIVILLSILLKLNKVIAFAFSNISLPPFIPLVLLLSLKTGNFILGFETRYSLTELRENFDLLQHLQAYLVGSMVLSISCAFGFGLLSYMIFSLVDRKKVLTHG